MLLYVCAFEHSNLPIYSFDTYLKDAILALSRGAWKNNESQMVVKNTS